MKIDKTHKSRINLAFEYIDAHLEEELSLENIAGAANYSPYHFHRIFKSITGETLQEFIHRRRVEKTASLLMHKPDMSITEVAYQLGFSSNASFTKAFKKYYHISPTLFRKNLPDKYSQIEHQNSKIGQIEPQFEKYICALTNHLNWIQMNGNASVQNHDTLHLAYQSHIGACELLPNIFRKVIAWATTQQLWSDEAKMIVMYHSSPKITAPDKMRYSAGMLLDQKVETGDAINYKSIAPNKYVVGKFEIHPKDLEQAWTSLYVWLNENGYTTSGDDPFEIYHTDPNSHPEFKCIIECCIPIQ